MIINTKFEVDQEVYYLQDTSIRRGTIYQVLGSLRKEGYTVKTYSILDSWDQTQVGRDEKDVYATVKEVLEDLENRYKTKDKRMRGEIEPEGPQSD